MTAKIAQLHPERPDVRLYEQIALSLKNEGVVVYPTDSSYALGCCAFASTAGRRIAQIRGENFQSQRLTLICPNLSKLSEYANYDKNTYRLLRQCTPGPYTFIMSISRSLPRRLADRRKHIGLRIPDDPVVQGILEHLEEPLLSATLIFPEDDAPCGDPSEFPKSLSRQVDWIIDAGVRSRGETTIIDCTGNTPHIVRQGLGSDPFASN
ncbi:MAG: threonylcarbamoyl-AMP synthase [Gammaproteobacteria bacterium AqS3]|nr:threonylcarbamoyl-AMP synthase [Gammaproteobacteria bacterium AqS3]